MLTISFRNAARDLDASPLLGVPFRFYHAQMVKGGTLVRRDAQTYPMSYLMCVLYALIVIVLAAVFLL